MSCFWVLSYFLDGEICAGFLYWLLNETDRWILYEISSDIGLYQHEVSDLDYVKSTFGTGKIFGYNIEQCT